jgi:biopolymer transport protein ExbD
VGAAVGNKKGGFSDMNLTPLIDIVLVVLIIMMVNIPIEVETLGLKLPAKLENQPPPPAIPPDQLVIGMYEDGTLALNRRLMSEQVLFYEITRRLRPMDPKNVFLDAHQKVPFGRVVDMMDLAREAGAAKVGLTKLKPTGPQPPTSVAPGSAPRGLQIGAPSVVGALGQADADAAIQPYKGNLEQCYLAQLPMAPEMNGRVLGKVSVGPQGEVMSHSILSSALENPAVEECVDQVLGSLRFKPLGPNKTAWVQFPLLYSPG